MTKPQNIASIEKATNKSWEEWLAWLSQQNASALSHPDIAQLVHNELAGKIDSPGWWTQGITVAYEQSIGRRAPGQRSDGSFEVSVSVTRDGTREDVFTACLDVLAGVTNFDNRPVHNVRTSTTPVRSYWRCDFDDGSKVAWAVEQKAPGKVLLVVSHTDLASSQQATFWRTFWKSYLEDMQHGK